ncbi:MAG: GNAT family N-acetyltransferase [Deltaproteobacteria bacterium]|nr:GNAT family N-acetyltransferase [Deltaproteobacteria bacterium]
MARQVVNGPKAGVATVSSHGSTLRCVDDAGVEFVIRQARPSDAGAVGDILAELARSEDFILLSPEEIGADVVRRAEDLARMEKNSVRWHVAIVEQAGGIVGMLDLRAVPLKKCDHVMELGLGLVAEATDRGIGTQLILYALARARDLGYRKVRLFVIACNDRARHVYRKVGFEETGRFIDEVRVGDGIEDLIVMEKPLQ